MNNRNKGMMFCFEGVDGSGKTSTMKLVAEILRNKGFDVLETCEPTKNEFGMKVRNLLFESGDIAKGSEFFLFLADRCEHIEKVINPALEAGKIVLCDRFDASTIAYQDMAHYDYMDKVCEKKWESLVLSLADIDVSVIRRILFDCPADVAFDRLNKREELNKYDKVSIEQLAKIRVDYLKMENAGNFDLCINAEHSQEQNADIIAGYILGEIKKCKN